MKNKITVLLSSFLPVLAALGIQLAAAFLVSFWFSVVSVVRLLVEGISDPELLMSGLLTLLTDPLYNDILMSVTFVALAVVFLLWYRKQKDKTIPASFEEVFRIRHLAIFLFSGLAAQVAVSMCLNLILPLFPQTMEAYTALLENLVGGNIIVSVISTAVLAPIAEEIIFRELMTRKLCRLFPFWFANLIQALAFGIYHLNIVQGIYAFFLGLILGYVAYRMKSIWASIMLHGIMNASGLVLDIILPDALFESTVGMIIFAILCSAITLLLTLLYRIPESGEAINNIRSIPDVSLGSVDFPMASAETPSIIEISEDNASSLSELSDADDEEENSDSPC